MGRGKEPLSAVPRVMLKERGSSRSPTLYGRDREKKGIFDVLLSDRAKGSSVGNTCVIGFVGKDGIGKTTLADLVYHDARVKLCFKLRCWVELQEQQVDAASLARMILDRLDENFHYDDESLEEELIGRLREFLHGKKLLLVLDGCRKLAGWETLLKGFAHVVGRGSVVILTSRRMPDPMDMLSRRILHLDLLSLEDSYSSFSEHAFGDIDQGSHPELVSLAIQIVRKLGGSPRATKNLGCLLYGHRDIDMWTKLLKMEPSDLMDLERLKTHFPELSHKRLEQVSKCNRCLVVSPPTMPDKHEVMALRGLKILVPSLARVTSESNNDYNDGGNDDDDNDEALNMSSSESYYKCVKVACASELTNLPGGLKVLRIEGGPFLQNLPDKFLSDCPRIKELSFIDCCSLKHFADVLHPTSLRRLRIQQCPSLEFSIPLGTHEKFALLEHLSLTSSCKSLKSICLDHFPRLETLCVKDCPNLESISMAEGLCNRNLKLRYVNISDCHSLISFPERGLPAPDLESISISNCRSLKALPQSSGSSYITQTIVYRQMSGA